MKQTLLHPKPLRSFTQHHMFMRTPLWSLSSESKTGRCTTRLKGFTLIELLVVISIIAILTVIGIVSYATVQKNVRDARRKIDINYIGQAIEATYNPGTNAYSFTGEVGIPKDPLDGANSNNRYWYSNNPTRVTATGAISGDSIGVIADSMVSPNNIASFYYVCAPLEITGSGNSTCTVAAGAPGVLTKAAGNTTSSCYCQVSKQKQ